MKHTQFYDGDVLVGEVENGVAPEAAFEIGYAVGFKRAVDRYTDMEPPDVVRLSRREAFKVGDHSVPWNIYMTMKDACERGAQWQALAIMRLFPQWADASDLTLGRILKATFKHAVL